MPSGVGSYTEEGGSHSDVEDKVVLDPRTPSDYALHAIFIRFAAIAESHIDEFLRFPVVGICKVFAAGHRIDKDGVGS